MDDAYRDECGNKHLRVNFESDAVNYRRNSSFPSSSTSSPSSPSSSSSSSPRSSLESFVNDKKDGNNPCVTRTRPDQESQGALSLPEGYSSPSLPGSMQSGSSAQSSPFQMMGRPAGYDPSRIPSNIFASKPPAGMDWSVASNESLFSLHVGNNSFSRDQFALLNKSGELYKSGELTRHDEYIYIPTPLPTVTEVETIEIKIHNVGKEKVENKAPNMEAKIEENESANVEYKVESMRENVETESVEETEGPDESANAKAVKKEKVPLIGEIRNSAASYQSDGSNNSTKSFQFPVLENHEVERNIPAEINSGKLQSAHAQQEMHKQVGTEAQETPLKAATTQTTISKNLKACPIGGVPLGVRFGTPTRVWVEEKPQKKKKPRER
ncbi:hypothetical protein ACFX2J_045076 [Malus domestica]